MCIFAFHISVAHHSLPLLISFRAYFPNMSQINSLFFIPYGHPCALGHQMPDTCKYSLISWKHSYSPPNHKAIFNKCKSISLQIKILQQLPTVFKLLDGVSRLSTIWSHLVSCHSLLCTFLPAMLGFSQFHEFCMILLCLHPFSINIILALLPSFYIQLLGLSLNVNFLGRYSSNIHYSLL